MPITGSSSFTLFLFYDNGFDSYFILTDYDVEAPLILGVPGVLTGLVSPRSGLSRTELTEELLLLDVVSISRALSLDEREGFTSNSLGRDTLKIKSVGILGVES